MPPSNGSITLRAVAAAAGVSLAAASFALRKSGKVSPATRARVQQAAAKLGYRPDRRVSETMRRIRLDQPVAYRETLAVLDTWPDRGAWKTPVANRHYAAGIAARAQELGYRLEEFWLRAPGQSHRRLGEILEHRGIRGLIVPPLIDPAYAVELDWSKFAAVTIGPSCTVPIHRVCNHRFRTVQLAIGRLRALGYRKIGFAMPRHPIAHVNDFWCSGFLTYEAVVAPQERIPILMHENYDGPGLPEWFRTQAPDALLLHNLAQIAALEAAGLRVGRDFGLAYLNWEKDLAHLAGVDQQTEVMGATTVDCLLGLLVRGELGLPSAPQEIMIECRWRDGPSAPAAATRPDGNPRGNPPAKPS